jgi:thiamine biosynthesis lipoprotein
MMISRRKFLVTASAAGAACAVGAFIMTGDEAPTYVWRGSALGGEARVALYGAAEADAKEALAAVAQEIERLEDIFSLHRPGSEISRLNGAGALEGASRDLIEVLNSAEVWRTKTGGAFNPLIQPLWQAAATGAEITKSQRPDLHFKSDRTASRGRHHAQWHRAGTHRRQGHRDPD